MANAWGFLNGMTHSYEVTAHLLLALLVLRKNLRQAC